LGRTRLLVFFNVFALEYKKERNLLFGLIILSLDKKLDAIKQTHNNNNNINNINININKTA
jgi:hypothetical protein